MRERKEREKRRNQRGRHTKMMNSHGRRRGRRRTKEEWKTRI